MRCWLSWVVYHVSILSVLRLHCKCKCMRDVLPKPFGMSSYRNHKIALNVIALPLSPIICESSICLLYMCKLYFFFPWNLTSFKRPRVAKSNPWHWVCQLSLTVGLQPLPGAALKGGVTPPLTGLLTPHGLICHLGPDMFNRVHICFLAQWVVILLLPLHLFFCTKWHKFQVTEKHFDMFWVKGSQKMDSWFDNDWCISCLIPLFAVLCSEKMERSLEMTEKAVLKHCESLQYVSLLTIIIVWAKWKHWWTDLKKDDVYSVLAQPGSSSVTWNWHSTPFRIFSQKAILEYHSSTK